MNIWVTMPLMNLTGDGDASLLRHGRRRHQLIVGVNFVGVFDDLHATGCGDHAAFAAREDLAVQLLLQIADSNTQTGGHKVEIFCRCGNRAGAVDLQKIFDLLKGHKATPFFLTITQTGKKRNIKNNKSTGEIPLGTEYRKPWYNDGRPGMPE